MSKAAYEIRAAGNVPVSVVEDFEGVTVSTDPAGSTIHVHLADEAELHGLLDALRRGGFLLIDVRRDPVYGLGEESSVDDVPTRGSVSYGLTTIHPKLTEQPSRQRLESSPPCSSSCGPSPSCC